MTSVDPARFNPAVGRLRTAAETFDIRASAAPASIEAGAATSLVAGWVADLCCSGVEALTAISTLCAAADAARDELLICDDDAAATVAFMGVGS